ncbi:DUF1542 domain-containing protein, partial [Staphylococcus epidermidis]|uniref:DUF1542 domain-containing protein n=1 Tax=Staphylococcus epidermidis TaxID=1282 RepID=UPI001C930669
PITPLASQLNNSINNTPYPTQQQPQIPLNKLNPILHHPNQKIPQPNTHTQVLPTKSNPITLLQPITADLQLKP